MATLSSSGPELQIEEPTKRQMIRWNDDDNIVLLLALEKTIKERVNKFPWTAVADAMGNRVSAGAIEQHISKLRRKRAEVGYPIPEKTKRARRSGLLEPSAGPMLDTVSSAPVLKTDLALRHRPDDPENHDIIDKPETLKSQRKKRGPKPKARKVYESDEESDYETTVINSKGTKSRPAIIKEESDIEEQVKLLSPKRRKTTRKADNEANQEADEEVDEKVDHTKSKMVVLKIQPDVLQNYPNSRFLADEQGIDFIVNEYELTSNMAADITYHGPAVAYNSLLPQPSAMVMYNSLTNPAVVSYHGSSQFAPTMPGISQYSQPGLYPAFIQHNPAADPITSAAISVDSFMDGTYSYASFPASISSTHPSDSHVSMSDVIYDASTIFSGIETSMSAGDSYGAWTIDLLGMNHGVPTVCNQVPQHGAFRGDNSGLMVKVGNDDLDHDFKQLTPADSNPSIGHSTNGSFSSTSDDDLKVGLFPKDSDFDIPSLGDSMTISYEPEDYDDITGVDT